VSFWGNFGLGVYKLVVGILGGSSALVADAMHSFADVVGSVGIVLATRVSAKDADEEYPYGRGKAEFLGAVFVYVVLLFFAVGIVVHAITLMLNDDLSAPHYVTALGAAVSVLHNIIMFQYLTCVGRRNNSPAILADAFENRADAISSVAAVAGIIGAMVIHPICDPIAALLVGVIIFWNCQEQLREAVKGLMDTALPEDEAEEAVEAILGCEGVEALAFLRTRRTGARYWLDVGVEVHESLGIEAADAIASRVGLELARYPFCHHAEVFVLPHGRPADDGPSAPSPLAPEVVRDVDE
jgi:cation diffusion facilitator family transporter